MIADLVRAWRAARVQTDLLDDVVFQKLGINGTDGRCLDALSEGPMTATVLARASGVSANALTTVVDRLAKRGLVERVRDTADRRQVVIRLTQLADHLSAQLYGPVMARSLQNLKRYTTDELALVSRFISQGTVVQAEHVQYVRELTLSWDLPSVGGEMPDPAPEADV